MAGALKVSPEHDCQLAGWSLYRTSGEGEIILNRTESASMLSQGHASQIKGKLCGKVRKGSYCHYFEIFHLASLQKNKKR